MFPSFLASPVGRDFIAKMRKGENAEFSRTTGMHRMHRISSLPSSFSRVFAPSRFRDDSVRRGSQQGARRRVRAQWVHHRNVLSIVLGPAAARNRQIEPNSSRRRRSRPAPLPCPALALGRSFSAGYPNGLERPFYGLARRSCPSAGPNRRPTCRNVRRSSFACRSCRARPSRPSWGSPACFPPNEPPPR